MNKALLFATLTKVDLEKRLVWGQGAAEVKDKVGEKLDYAKSKPYFEAWSGEMAKATNGSNLGNVREMHGKVAAGKLTEITYNDAAKTIDVCAKVVDDQAWAKVKDGIYTGFSIGGEYVEKFNDPEEPGVKKYVARPSEISLVDNPCIPTAHFTAFKADGSREEVLFKLWTPTNDEIAARATKLHKKAGSTGSLADFMDTAREQLLLTRGIAEDEDDANDTLDSSEGEDESGQELDDAEGDDSVEFDEAPGNATGSSNVGGSSSKKKVGRKAYVTGQLAKLHPDWADTMVQAAARATKRDGLMTTTAIDKFLGELRIETLDKAEPGQEPDVAAAEAAKEAAKTALESKTAEGAGGGAAAGTLEGADHTKADWGVDQVFMVRADRATFAKKGDALAHVAALQKVAESQSPIAAALAKALKAAKDDGKESPKPYGDVEYADPEDGKYPIDTAAHIRAAWSYVNMPKNADVLGSKAGSVKAKIVAAWKDKIDAAGPPSAEKMAAWADVPLHKMAELVVAIGERRVEKGFWTVTDVSYALCSLASILECVTWEEACEGDSDSKLPQMAQDAFAAARTLLVEMVSEESGELISAIQSNPQHGSIAFLETPSLMELAAKAEGLAKADTALLEKIGARNSKADAAKIQAVHDHATDLGAKCDKANCEDGDAEKLSPAALTKIAEVQREGVEAVAKLEGVITDMAAQIAKLNKQPAPMPTFRVVAKTDETTPEGRQNDPGAYQDPVEVLTRVVEQVGLEGVQKALMKSALGKPHTIVGSGGPSQ